MLPTVSQPTYCLFPAWYVIVTLVLLSLSLLLGSIVVNLSICTADTKPVPAWVRRLVLRYMSLVLCMGDLSECRVVDEEQVNISIVMCDFLLLLFSVRRRFQTNYRQISTRLPAICCRSQWRPGRGFWMIEPCRCFRSTPKRRMARK